MNKNDFNKIKPVIFINVGILTLLIVVVGIAWYSALIQNREATSPQSSQVPINEISDWQTYHNEEFGFEVKYPFSWTLNTKKVLSVNLPDQSRNFIQVNMSNHIKGSEDESMSRCQPGIAAIVYQIGKLRDNQKNFEDFVNFQIENPERGMPPVAKPELIPVTVGGRNTLKIEEVVDSCKTEFYYVDQDPEHYTTISFIVKENNDKLVIEQILSNFEFLD